ncbi:MAG: hypothetical protein KAX28_05625 [Candidatus Marinimicrobia bacterium]|nr:hypothetical protein [Candidatus Neomarinimicrobiota bacterium]
MAESVKIVYSGIGIFNYNENKRNKGSFIQTLSETVAKKGGEAKASDSNLIRSGVL